MPQKPQKEESAQYCYQRGCGAEKKDSMKSAIHWFTKAASKGHSDAIVKLATIYASDILNCEANYSQQKHRFIALLLDRAIKLGNNNAKGTLKKLERRFGHIDINPPKQEQKNDICLTERREPYQDVQWDGLWHTVTPLERQLSEERRIYDGRLQEETTTQEQNKDDQ